MLRRRRFLVGLGAGILALLLPVRAFLVATLKATPNPAPVSTLVAIAGSGFQNFKTRLMLDGVGATTNIFRPRKDGTFNVGITVSSTPKTQTLVAQQFNSTWTDTANTSIVVEAITITPSPVPTPAPASGVYGSAQGESRNNHQIGNPANHRLAYRFKATTTSQATTLRVQQRGLGGSTSYSGGTGGVIRASIQSDSGGVPSGVFLAQLQWTPGNPTGAWEVWTELPFPNPASLTAGTIYHIVFDNIDPNPELNWISLNMLFVFTATVPRQPTWADEDYAVHWTDSRTGSNAWILQTHDTPIMDLKYADGTHDGMNYIGAEPGNSYAVISGTASMARERFTVTGGDRTVSTVGVRLKRISGTSPVTLSLKMGVGTLIEAVTVPSSGIPIGNYPTAAPGGEASYGNNAWAVANFTTPRTLTNGQTYDLIVSTAADTTYCVTPIQKGTTKGMQSVCFRDGYGQKTTDGGASWPYIYPYIDTAQVDMQFYFR